MTLRRITLKRFTIALAAIAVGCAATVAVAATRPHPPTWAPKQVIQYLPDSNHSQYDAVITEPGQAWFFGGSNVVKERGVPELLYRKNGHWQVPPALPPGLTSWITAASAVSPDDMWAVTRFGGSVLFWDGTEWTLAQNGGWDTTAQFTGITAIGLGDVWLFGSQSGGHVGAGTWHLTSGGWKQVLGVAANLNRGSGTGRDDIWAIGGANGSMKVLAHFDGSAWTRRQPPALAGLRYSDVLALTPGNVWVAGSVAGQPELGHFNGHSWTALTMPGTHAATGMCRDGRGGLWVIANSGTRPSVVRHLSAARKWSLAQVSPNAANEVLACALVPGRRAAWGAGKAAPKPGAKGSAAAAYGTGPVP